MPGAADRNARFVAHQILDVVDVLPVELLAAAHAHAARHLVGGSFVARRADGDVLQLQGFVGEGKRWGEE